jgi:hypothetical protein
MNMATSTEEAAKLIVHYLRTALGDRITASCNDELDAIVEAFAYADRRIGEIGAARRDPQ